MGIEDGEIVEALADRLLRDGMRPTSETTGSDRQRMWTSNSHQFTTVRAAVAELLGRAVEAEILRRLEPR